MTFELNDNFPEIVAEYRYLGYNDDDIAHRLGIQTDSLHRQFRKWGIPYGRRWRDIEDAKVAHPISENDVRGMRSRRLA